MYDINFLPGELTRLAVENDAVYDLLMTIVAARRDDGIYDFNYHKNALRIIDAACDAAGRAFDQRLRG